MSEERIKTKVQMGILKPVHEIFEAIVDPEKMNKYFVTTMKGGDICKTIISLS